MGIPALEDGLFANVLIFDDFQDFESRKGRKGHKGRKGLQALGGISFCFSRNFTSNAVRTMSEDPLGPEL